MAGASGKPGRDCPLCPRLHALRHEWRCREPQWFNAPVPSFGSPTARLLIVGLAPGLREPIGQDGHSRATMPAICFTRP